MNAFRKAWRQQKAVNRARTIRRYRKGHPKLGCFKCWYDCYEVEGERCPECNAEIERGAPWWRDGKWSVVFLATIGLVPPALSIAGYVWLLRTFSQSHGAASDLFIPLALYKGPLFLLPPVIAFFPIAHARKRRNMTARLYVALGPTILWMLVTVVLERNLVAV